MIIRNYGCEDCGLEWEVTVEDGNAPDPECPTCSQVLQWIPSRVNIGTTKGKAIDLTQQIIEQDFGLTDLKDNNREGDVAYKEAAPMQTAERETIEQAVREYVRETTREVPIPTENLVVPQARGGDVKMPFFGAAGAGPANIAAQPISTALALQAAKMGPEANVNGMEMLQRGIRSGQIPSKMGKIMSRWKP